MTSSGKSAVQRNRENPRSGESAIANAADDSPAAGISAAVLASISATLLLAGGWLTSLGLNEWYYGLNFPPFQPPGWVFTPVWTLLFVLLARATWLVVQAPAPKGLLSWSMGLYGAQCVLNLGWSLLFFGLQRPDAALWEIVVLDCVVCAMMFVYAKISMRAGLMIAPYAAWVMFATAINFWIVRNNGPF